ncbi:hypothetical protein MG290_02585 [Flavobacterium sp. CBA20B-1]|uniref:hypothetical protein n=1 Tax=unclassified Flavobacterium TaxID=196869 RepID=UPI0022259D6A|nr:MULTISPECIES: hypothetical protein [unclassified Flavobacterium]WCM42579.1 hypothetical protein MG290_02585 [Flavobacterium sp. CBA20B-1]
MKKTLLTIALLMGFCSQAQDFLFGPSISYQSQAGNVLKVGGYYMQPLAQNEVGIKLEANANMAYFRERFVVIPEGSFTFYPTLNRLIVPFAEGEISPYTVTPKVGLSIATMLELGVGYGFDMQTKQDVKPIKGFTFSLGFYIPLNAF